MTSVERLLPYWQQNTSRRTSDQRFHTPAEVSLDRVSFSYGSKGSRDEVILNSLSCTFPAGQKVGICGRTGCGKSTLLKVLAGLYACEQGSLSVGQVSVTAEHVANWRQSVMTIRQQPAYSLGSILVALGDVAEPIALQAIRKVGLMASFDRQGLQLSDPVTRWSMSPGERQLFGIARALVAKEWFLIFDEVTSSLDQESREHFYSLIAEFDGQKTLAIVSHDLGTLLALDKVIVLSEGSIVEVGCPRQLAAEQGSEFSQLFSNAEAVSVKSE